MIERSPRWAVFLALLICSFRPNAAAAQQSSFPTATPTAAQTSPSQVNRCDACDRCPVQVDEAEMERLVAEVLADDGTAPDSAEDLESLTEQDLGTLSQCSYPSPAAAAAAPAAKAPAAAIIPKTRRYHLTVILDVGLKQLREGADQTEIDEQTKKQLRKMVELIRAFDLDVSIEIHYNNCQLFRLFKQKIREEVLCSGMKWRKIKKILKALDGEYRWPFRWVNRIAAREVSKGYAQVKGAIQKFGDDLIAELKAQDVIHYYSYSNGSGSFDGGVWIRSSDIPLLKDKPIYRTMTQMQEGMDAMKKLLPADSKR